MKWSGVQYFVFAPRSGLVLAHDDVYTAAYEAWRAVWADVHREIGHSADLSADEFIRHDLCCVLTSGAEVAGVHLYSFFDLQQPLQLKRRYLTDNFDEFSLRAIDKQGCRRVMTMEYLSVTPGFRGAKSEFSVAELMIALGLRVFLTEETLDGVIACTRNSRKVNSMAAKFGFKTLARDRVTHGETADLILFPRGEVSQAEQQLQSGIDQLWLNKMDLRKKDNKGALRAA